MPFYIISGLIGLAVIVISCELFTNSIAWTGIRFKLNHVHAGKILTAAGPAIPEIIIPVIAVILVIGERGQEISSGAILGAPLLLSTLAFGLVGITALVYGAADKRQADFKAEEKIFLNDLMFFVALYAAAIIFSFFPVMVKKALGFLFLAAYAVYIYGAPGKGRLGAEDKKLRDLYFSKKKHPEGKLVLLQAGVSVLGLVTGAGFFVTGIEHVAAAVNLPVFMFSIFLAPAATELPKILNSLILIKNKKETLALIHISKALVFQSTVVIFAGIMATDWILGPQAKLAAGITAGSALLILTLVKISKKINAFILLPGTVFYFLFVIAVLKWAK